MTLTENDILRRVRKVEIKTRGLSDEIFAGKYHTADYHDAKQLCCT